MNKNKYDLTVGELFENVPKNLRGDFDKVNYAWEIIPKIKEIVGRIIENGEGYTVLTDGVLVGKNVKIAETATIIPPAIIGNGVEIRPGAYIRGNVYIGDGCVVGNSTELKNCVLLSRVQVPHYNYVGDSILGNYSHLGAGAICSNFRSDGKNVVVHAERDYETNLRKFGAILGDHAEVGCGSVLNPGTVIGKRTQVYPLTMARGVYPRDSIVKSMKKVVKKKRKRGTV